MKNYILTDEADADMRSVVRYTRKQWGEVQARRYVDKLKAGIARLIASEGAFKDMGAIYPALRMSHCEHHYLFCLPREEAPALIVAIL